MAAALLACAGVAATASSRFIAFRYPDRPMPGDLLLDALPYVPVTQYVADAAVWLAMIAGLLALWRWARPRIPEAVAVIATMYLIRAALVVLTPLASPHGGGGYGFMPAQNGMVPSGHSANVLLCFLLVSEIAPPWVRRLVLALAVTEWVALLLSRGHYSIDIAAGLLLAYFVWAEWTRGRLFDPLRRLVGGPGVEARA